MVSLIRVQSGASMPVLLQLLAGAQEFHSICLRRSEKKVLNTLNKNAACVRYSVEDPVKPGKATPRIKSAAEKILILVRQLRLAPKLCLSPRSSWSSRSRQLCTAASPNSEAV